MDYKQSSKGHQRREDDPKTKLSKSLSYLLRHGAQKEGVPMRPDGYIKISDVTQWKSLKNVSFKQIQEVVENNNKKRFELLDIEVDGQKECYIRAVQGHSLNHVQDDLLLQKIEDSSSYPIVIHGTDFRSWKMIEHQGLKTMGRNHVHFAQGMPGSQEVISGMRLTCQIFIEINLERAIGDGMLFYVSKNNVILSSGFDEVIHPIYFKRVTDNNGKVLLEQISTTLS